MEVEVADSVKNGLPHRGPAPLLRGKEMKCSHEGYVDAYGCKGRPKITIAAAVGKEDKDQKSCGNLEDVGDQEEDSTDRVGAKEKCTVLLDRLVEGERPSQAET